METSVVIAALSALAHPGRLAIYRLLVAVGGVGSAAGEIANSVGAPANTTSTNLGILQTAGLITSRREGRHVRYWTDHEAMRNLLGYLIEDCCGGRPEICAPLIGARARVPVC
ncbi:MAG: transcriptional regulator [Brevundimonas subvibrioides]|uniref:Transcriptional regulator n=1 Tax=Brevundimonas subvibrioides TaxID=74313 RepID=A0A258HRX7_9CAUL|nr:helix-turn-helix transcriptional regulator [Brevundimonas subvibrioides]OYX59083.1 MAG: transcriptional regulator [Brevundimonas subvibrioides]